MVDLASVGAPSPQALPVGEQNFLPLVRMQSGNLGLTTPRIAQDVLSAFQLPHDVATGKVSTNPNDPELIGRSLSAIGLAGGSQFLSAPKAALGAFGGKVGARGGLTQKLDGAIRQSVDLPKGRVDIDFSVAGTGHKGGTMIEIDFAVPGVSAKTGKRSKGAAGALDVLPTVMDRVGNFIARVRPEQVSFTSSRPELVPIYKRVADRLAQKFGGAVQTFGSDKKGRIFIINLPEPRQLADFR